MIVQKEVLFTLALLLVVVSIVNTFTMLTLTGKAVTSVGGNTTICINGPPTLSSIANQTVSQNSLFTLQVNATEPDNHVLVYSDNTTLFAINTSTGLINFTPNSSQIGNYSINISVRDNVGECSITASRTFLLSVGNTAPVLNTTVPNQTWEQNVQLTGLDLDGYFSDAENDTLTYTERNGGHVTITISSAGVVTFTPETNFASATWVIFTANDTLLTATSNNITLNITGDTVAPAITINAPNQTQLVSRLQTTLNVSISEIGKIVYNLDNQGNATLCSLCASGVTTINLSSFGNHSITIYGIDAVDNTNSSTREFNATMDTDGDGTPDDEDNDRDGDGIGNTIDPVVGNRSSLTGNSVRFNVTINSSVNLSQRFNSTLQVNITNGTSPLVEFQFDFTQNNTINLPNITLTKQSDAASLGSIIVRGLVLPSGTTKTIYVDALAGYNELCIEDAEISSLGQISSNCTGASEFKVKCHGSSNTNGSYTCTDMGTSYKISGANHSGVVEVQNSSSSGSSSSSSDSSSSSTTSTSGGGGGGSIVTQEGACRVSQECSAWVPSQCTEGKQTRICTETTADCLTVSNSEDRECVCTPRWECTIWVPEECSESGVQERACIDLNNCGMKTELPLQKECAIAGEGRRAIAGRAIFDQFKTLGEDLSVYWIGFIVLVVGIIFALYYYFQKGKESTVISPHPPNVEVIPPLPERETKKVFIRQPKELTILHKKSVSKNTLEQERLRVEQELEKLK